MATERADAQHLASLVSGHWAIENRLHRLRDVAFSEDASQGRSDHALQTTLAHACSVGVAALRNTAIAPICLLDFNGIAPALRYFAAHPAKASWAERFKSQATTGSAFTRLDGSRVTTPMMHNVPIYRHGASPGYVAVELPYYGQTTSMVIVMPDQGQFAEFEARLTAEQLDTILAGLQPAMIDLKMPLAQNDLCCLFGHSRQDAAVHGAGAPFAFPQHQRLLHRLMAD